MQENSIINGLTRSERNHRGGGRAEEAGVASAQLLVVDANELSVDGRLEAEQAGRDDTEDLDGVPRVPAVGEREVDEVVAVGDSLRLGKRDHRVRDEVLVAGVRGLQKRIDARKAAERGTWVVREDVAAAGQAERLPGLYEGGDALLEGDRRRVVHREFVVNPDGLAEAVVARPEASGAARRGTVGRRSGVVRRSWGTEGCVGGSSGVVRCGRSSDRSISGETEGRVRSGGIVCGRRSHWDIRS